MNRVSTSLLFLFFASRLLFCQSDSSAIYFTPANVLRFADFLNNRNEYLPAATEYERFLLLTKSDNDSIPFIIGKCYLNAGRNDLAKTHLHSLYSQTKSSEVSAQALLWLSYAYFMNNEYDSCALLINHDNYERFSPGDQERSQLLGNAYLIAKNKSPFDQENFHDTTGRFQQLIELDRDRATNSSDKSPILAAGLSALVPGLGKIYGGRTVDGIFSFVSITIAGWQAYNGFSKDGVKSIKGWLVGTLGFTFYAGNIYGSAMNITLQNKINETQFNHNLHAVVKASFGL